MAMGQAETRATRVSSGLKFTRAAERQVGTGRVVMGWGGGAVSVGAKGVGGVLGIRVAKGEPFDGSHFQDQRLGLGYKG